MCVCAQSLRHVWLFVIPLACSPPSSSVHGIFHARMLEWIVISSSRVSSQCKRHGFSPCMSLLSPALARGFFTGWTTKVRDNNSTSCMRIKWIDFCKAFRTVLDTELNSVSINYYFPYITSFICLLPCIFPSCFPAPTVMGREGGKAQCLKEWYSLRIGHKLIITK